MKKTVLISLAVLVVLVSLIFLAIVGRGTDNTAPERIHIAEGISQASLMDTLATRGILHRTTLLNAELKALKYRPRPGSYLIEPRTRLLTLARKLRNGQQDPIRLTIGKFRTPKQLNEYLNSKLMHNDFDITLDTFHIIRPDTYEFYWTVTPEAFLQRMKREYDRQGLCRETVILASIVEEESNYNPEKPLIASVYLNRLKRGMPLQADPTVKYAVGDFTLRRILNKHLTVESPFNTYLHTGLPPAPICLPSAASVEAVLNARETDYLYFCASDRMDGTHRFAATLAEHNRNAARFHAALNAKGIR